ncbi:mRNA 3' end processing factor [Coemansia erecta]|uniref:mRNA 3' end processing factor n=1 Tax=Coemansia erecta TaxID=147472 RepID=A0A9W7XZP2_9FUNG|nr:mRNA 3' end processing factor [Coemansia erecta]
MASSTKTASGQINRELFREYRSALSKLTFNSKPIITDLSKKAQSHMDDAETIIKAIEDHLRFSEPSIKLPTFYLLDSIFKNVGGMYISLVHGRLGNIFVNMWKSVDSKVKGNMERTLASWRDGFEGGHQNLFPDFVLRKIEEDLNRLKAKAKDYVSTPPPPKSDNLLDDLTNIQSYSKKRALEERQQSIQREVTARADRHTSSNGSRSSSHHTSSRRQSHHEPQEHSHPHLHSHKKMRANGDAMAGKDSTLLQEVQRVINKKKIDLLRRPSDAVLFTALETLKAIKEVASDPDLHPSRVEEIRRQLAGIEFGTLPLGSNGVKKSSTPPLSPGIASAAGYGVPSAASNYAPSVNPNHILNNIMSRPDLISSLSKVVPGLSNSLGSLLVPPHQQEAPDYTHFSQLEPVPLTQTSITK